MRLIMGHNGSATLAVLLALCIVGHAQNPAQEQFDFANGLFHRGFYAEAIDEYEQFLEQASQGVQAATAWLRLGRAAMATDDYEKALHAFEQVVAMAATRETRLEALVSQGEVLVMAGRHDDAIALLTDIDLAAAPPPVRARALFHLGRARHISGAMEQAAAAYETLTSELPNDALTPFAHYHLAFACIALERLEAAATAFSAAANADSADDELRMESRFRAAELYDKLGWTAAALGAYEQLRSDYPDSEYARRADYGYAWALYHDGQYDAAAAAADAFLGQHRESPRAPGLEYLQGNCLYQQGQYTEALTVYAALRDAHADTPFAARALYKSAWAHYLLGNVQDAHGLARMFLDQHPEHEFAGETAYLLGIIHAASGDYEEALKEFRFVAVTFPDSEFSADALFKSAECYAQLGLRDEAARVFEDFAGQYPDNPLTAQALLRSGDARFTARDFDAALALYQQILDAPTDADVREDALYRKAAALHNMNRHADGAAAFRKLLDAFPESAHASEAHYRIGAFALHHNDDPLKAIEAYQAAFESASERAAAARALQGLAAAHYEQKDYEHTAAHLTQLITDYPESPPPAEAMLWCGQWLFDSERWQEAAVMLTALLDFHPEHEHRAGIAFTLARSHEQAGATDAAMAAYQTALEQESEPGRLADTKLRLGGLYEAREDFARARELYEAAANLDGGETSARARFQLAALYESQGAYEDAARNYMRLAILFVHEHLSPEALWRAAHCYRVLENDAQAIGILEELTTDYPESSFARQAQELLRDLQGSAE